MDNNVMLPRGEFAAANGSRYHLRRFGDSGPTVLLECGLTMMSSCWGWLAPKLAKTNRVFTYDRAGLGWSDEREGLRDAAQIAQELNGLLKAAKIRAPIVLLGHSMGAMFNRAYFQLNPAFVRAVVWLDPAHPDQLARSRRMRTFFFLLEWAHLFAARNLPPITLRIVPHLAGLPDEDYRNIRFFLKNGRHLRASAREARAWNLSADCVRGSNLGDIPLLIISAQKNALRDWREHQQDLAGLSSRSRHRIFTEMSHLSMLAHHEQVERVVREIDSFLRPLKL